MRQCPFLTWICASPFLFNIQADGYAACAHSHSTGDARGQGGPPTEHARVFTLLYLHLILFRCHHFQTVSECNVNFFGTDFINVIYILSLKHLYRVALGHQRYRSDEDASRLSANSSSLNSEMQTVKRSRIPWGRDK